MQPCAAAEVSAECTKGLFCLSGQTRMTREQPGSGRRGECGRRRGEFVPQALRLQNDLAPVCAFKRDARRHVGLNTCSQWLLQP